MTLFYFLLLFIFGLAVGSFINVVVDRLPQGESIFIGRSRCDYCRHVLTWWELAPIFSFFVLRGRCRYCGGRLSRQYPLVEGATGGLFVLTAMRFSAISGLGSLSSLGAKGWLSFLLILLVVLVFWVIFLTDWKYFLVPDKAVAVGILGSLGILGMRGFRELNGVWGEHLASAAGAAGFFLLLVLLTRGKGMGGGDVKLGFLIGLSLGWPASLVSLYLAFLTGGVAAVLLLATGRKKIGQEIPFAPFLTSSAIFVLLYEDWVLELSKRLIGLG